MNIAIPVWNGRVSPVFDAARWAMVIEIEGNVECHRHEIFLSEGPPSQRAKKLVDMGVDMLICGAISRSCEDLVKTSKITVMPWISGKVDEVLSAYIIGELKNSKFTMPGH